ncbi:hypothetical protein [Pedobacter cryoconitis]|uniref:Uncharacterized protein n=1 Tax=Pedobacter cryoconitis TaxID=188932 RepID=A0A327T7H6_9SPHI|nr:hypothetical protein [Pedobacter cryoconitis]RAJ37158.1 hypothetical protein LY11_00233 [Pedobacter cryoconitis]
MIYKGMEYTLPVTALLTELNYAVNISNLLTVADATDTMRIELTCRLSPAESNDGAVFNVFLDNLVINGRSEGDYEQTEWLFAKLFSINNELIVKTDRHGAIKGVGDKNRILLAWEIAKADINYIYEEGEVTEIVNSMDAALHDDLKSLYYNDLLLNLLFNNIYQTYIGEESIGTDKILLKHFGHTVLPVTEYKELIAIADDPKIATIAISGHINAQELDVEGMNHYLAEITEQESDAEMDYYFDYQGIYTVKIGAESYIETAELTITGNCDGYEKQAVYKLKLLGNE